MLNIIFDKFAAEPTPSTTYSPSWQLSQIKGGGGHNFFSFNSFATSLDNSTHPRTIELAKFGTACDNVIIPAAAAVACFFSLFFFCSDWTALTVIQSCHRSMAAVWV